MQGKKWPAAWSEFIATDFHAGLEMTEIASRLAEKFECSIDAKTVYKRLWRMGLTRPLREIVWTEERKAFMTERYMDPAGHPFSRIAIELNEKFGTTFTRSAVIAQSKRMQLAGKAASSSSVRYNEDGSIRPAMGRQKRQRQYKPRVNKAHPGRPAFDVIQLRCVELAPLHVTFQELEPHHCRWPYGGEENPASTTYCGHQRGAGAGQYCTAHFHLSLKPPGERRVVGSGFSLIKNGRVA